MKINSIALLTAITMLNVTPTVVLAQNGGNDTGPATSSSDTGTAPSMGTSNAPTGPVGPGMIPLQQQGTSATTDGSGSAPSSTDDGTGSATGSTGSDADNSSNSGSSSSH
ncbi:MAG: hypothetical protein K2Y08_04890 [Alphaproteobacteria bacterium]|nr:hypothetical protein [Alphaproteobacteria bacterium]